MSQSVTKWQYRFGLIGERLDYSFSPSYFSQIFDKLALSDTHTYDAWPLPTTAAVHAFLDKREFDGCNVTIPYKQLAADQCDILVGFAAISGAVNTIKNEDGILIGYNTDVYGILQTIKFNYVRNSELIIEKSPLPRVLILGSGGASLAVRAACDFLKWPFELVSRRLDAGGETYDSLNQNRHLSEFDVIVNTTPLGMSSYIDQIPNIQYAQLNKNHLVFDVIYNPKKTLLLERAEKFGAAIVNGELMLHEQADLAWIIWNN